MPLSGAPLAAPDRPPDTFVRGFWRSGRVSQRREGIGGNHYGCVSFGVYPGSVPHVEAAYLRAAATHDRAALLHQEAAELFEMMGLPSLARGERARARLDREGAASELERAELRHNLAVRGRASSPDTTPRQVSAS
jgi:hypothetical protein